MNNKHIKKKAKQRRQYQNVRRHIDPDSVENIHKCSKPRKNVFDGNKTFMVLMMMILISVMLMTAVIWQQSQKAEKHEAENNLSADTQPVAAHPDTPFAAEAEAKKRHPSTREPESSGMDEYMQDQDEDTRNKQDISGHRSDEADQNRLAAQQEPRETQRSVPSQNNNLNDLGDLSENTPESPWPDGFSLENISIELEQRMRSGGSLTVDTPVALSDLAYLQILYADFDGQTQTGEMVVHQKLAEEVLDIFTEIFKAGFPIESMRLIDDFGADDYASMAANNSYAFCTRPILGSLTGYSKHSYGIAIDINPMQNPYSRDGALLPEGSEPYADRETIRPGMIVPGTIVYDAFTRRGWTWGGYWNSLKDYHHFEKDLSEMRHD